MESVNYKKKKKKKPKQKILKYGKFNSVKESMNKIAFIRAFTLVSLKFFFIIYYKNLSVLFFVFYFILFYLF